MTSSVSSSRRCRFCNFDDVRIGTAFWERFDHAFRITLAAAYNGTIIFFTGQTVMPMGFMGLAPLLAFEPIERTVGACILNVPLLWRAVVVGSGLGTVGVVAILEPLLRLDGDGEGAQSTTTSTAYLAAFPFIAGATAFLIALSTWIPRNMNGLTMLMALFAFAYAPNNLDWVWQFLLTVAFGVSSSFLFKILPFPASSSLPSLSKSSTNTTTPPSSSIRSENRGRCPIQIRSALTLPKVDELIEEGRKLSANSIVMLAEVVTTSVTATTGYNPGDMADSSRGSEVEGLHEDDDIVKRRSLAVVQAMIKKLDSHVISQIATLQSQTSAEIRILPIGWGEDGVERIAGWLKLFRALFPTLQFILGIARTNLQNEARRIASDTSSSYGRDDDDGDDDPPQPQLLLQATFQGHMAVPIRSLARALYRALMDDDPRSVTSVLRCVNRSHVQLLTAMSDHRFHVFYRGVVEEEDDGHHHNPPTIDDETNNDGFVASTPRMMEWGFFVRGVALVHGMERLASAISLGTYDVQMTNDPKNNDIESGGKRREDRDDKETKGASSTRSCRPSLGSWYGDLAAIFLAGIDCRNPFAVGRDECFYAWSFCFQIALATLWFAIPVLNERMHDQGLFVSVTTCFIAVGKFGMSFQKSMQRIFGTAVATIWAMFVVVTLRLSPDEAINATYPYILVCLMIMNRKLPYTMDCAAFTAFIFIFRDEPFPSEEAFLLAVTFRIATVGIGIIQFIAIEMVFFRSSARTRVEEQSCSYFLLLHSVFEGLLEFSTNRRENRGEEETGKAILEMIEKSIIDCKTSTKTAQDEFVAAIQEPGAKIDVRPPFQTDHHKKLLSLQAETNCILSQILDSFHAVLATPEKDSEKDVYHEELNMLHEMIEGIAIPLKRLVSDYTPSIAGGYDTKDANTWLTNLRRFKKSVIKITVQTRFDLILNLSSAMQANDKAVMVEQAFVLQLCAVSRSLVEICERFQQASKCFEDIASSHPNFYSIDSIDSMTDKFLGEFDEEHEDHESAQLPEERV